jgi:transposase-like protein
MYKTKKLKIRRGGSFSIEERHEIIKEYLNGTETKTEIWRKHTGQKEEHGSILQWMRQLGYLREEISVEKERKRLIKSQHYFMPDNSSNTEKSKEALQKEIEALKAEVTKAKIQAEGFDLMIELAEKEFNIPIRKKSDTK